ncbi:glucose PTS transporter subunit IIA [Chromobacterium phragmitis]|uniref:glucose PTS transporter subunit IIA n=1 Tax=Chromobacterium phragmitis TaxID=2202141 RepID=UPI0038782F23
MGTTAPRLDVLAPLSGWLVPLDSVPDPVFAGKMVGDGVSLDPTSGSLLAPVSGVVSNLHSAHHALTITTPEGVEVMVHIGIDTVMLKGQGFFPLVEQGQQVSAGQPVIDFDLDQVARSAASLLTQIIVTNGDAVAHMQPAQGMVNAGRDVVLSLQLANGKDVPQAQAGEPQLSSDIAIGNPAGLHARPAAVFASKAKTFASDIQLILGDKEANAKSVVAIMGLATKLGDVVRVRAAGTDALSLSRKTATPNWPAWARPPASPSAASSITGCKNSTWRNKARAPMWSSRLSPAPPRRPPPSWTWSRPS